MVEILTREAISLIDEYFVLLKNHEVLPLYQPYKSKQKLL